MAKFHCKDYRYLCRQQNDRALRAFDSPCNIPQSSETHRAT